MSTSTKHHINRGLLWGQLLTGLEAAGEMLKKAERGTYLLTQRDRVLLDQARNIIAGVEQRAWEAQRVDGINTRALTRALRDGQKKDRP